MFSPRTWCAAAILNRRVWLCQERVCPPVVAGSRFSALANQPHFVTSGCPWLHERATHTLNFFSVNTGDLLKGLIFWCAESGNTTLFYMQMFRRCGWKVACKGGRMSEWVVRPCSVRNPGMGVGESPVCPPGPPCPCLQPTQWCSGFILGGCVCHISSHRKEQHLFSAVAMSVSLKRK